MKRYFRLAYFVPDPVTGWRVPVAAILCGPSGCRSVEFERMQGPEIVGGDEEVRLLRLLLDRLQAVDREEDLQARLGVHCELGGAVVIPDGVVDDEIFLRKDIQPGPFRFALSHGHR
jgi:hypothetical protein